MATVKELGGGLKSLATTLHSGTPGGGERNALHPGLAPGRSGHDPGFGLVDQPRVIATRGGIVKTRGREGARAPLPSGVLLAGLGTAVAAQAPLPEVFLFPHVLADPPAEDEERIAEPIDVA